MLQVHEGMTKLINCRFIEDFGTLVGSVTGEAKTRKVISRDRQRVRAKGLGFRV